MANNISLVIRREFLERVKKKSFIITTILMPVFMLAMMAAPALIMMVTGSEERGITVIDETGTIGARLQSDKETHFTLLESTPLDSALADTEVAGVLYIPAGIMDGKVSPRLYTNGSSSIALENNVSSQIDGIIEEERLKQYDIENLDKILEEVHSDVKLGIGFGVYRYSVEMLLLVVSFLYSLINSQPSFANSLATLLVS